MQLHLISALAAIATFTQIATTSPIARATESEEKPKIFSRATNLFKDCDSYCYGDPYGPCSTGCSPATIYSSPDWARLQMCQDAARMYSLSNLYFSISSRELEPRILNNSTVED